MTTLQTVLVTTLATLTSVSVRVIVDWITGVRRRQRWAMVKKERAEVEGWSGLTY